MILPNDVNLLQCRLHSTFLELCPEEGDLSERKLDLIEMSLV
jgi:hypothetical protein